MEPIISVICNTFNQENYIEQALNSLISQKVSVPYEILVNDDASTDSTSDIVRLYEGKYPGIVKPIYQIENQYSKGVNITPDIQIPRAKGKYIAFCEGDDYWTDENKLQIQYDFMEANPQYSICCHAYSMVGKNGELIEERYDLNGDGIVPIEKLIGNQLEVPHFSTLFVRAECLDGYDETFYGKYPNDMKLRLYCASKKPIYYLNKNMSSYRRFSEGSWTVRVGKNLDKFLKNQKEALVFLEHYDNYTDKIYHNIISDELERRRYAIDISEGNYKAAIKRKCFKKASLKSKIGVLAGCIFPNTVNKYQGSR